MRVSLSWRKTVVSSTTANDDAAYWCPEKKKGES